MAFRPAREGDCGCCNPGRRGTSGPGEGVLTTRCLPTDGGGGGRLLGLPALDGKAAGSLGVPAGGMCAAAG